MPGCGRTQIRAFDVLQQRVIIIIFRYEHLVYFDRGLKEFMTKKKELMNRKSSSLEKRINHSDTNIWCITTEG